MKNYQSIIFKTILTGLVVSLQACGSDPEPVPPPPAPAPVAPPVAPVSVVPANDYLGQNVIPQMQQYYGNVILQQPVTISGGLTLPAGPHAWAEVYGFVTTAMNGANCLQLQQFPQQMQAQMQNLGPWSYLNYGCFQRALLAGDINAMIATGVTFERFPGVFWNFYMVFDALVTANRGIYSSYYGNKYPVFYQGYNPYIGGGYNGTAVSGGISYNGGNLNVNIAGFFRR